MYKPLQLVVISNKCAQVVSVKVNNIRPQYNDLGEWMADSKNVYIGRKGVVFIVRDGNKIRYPPTDSIWANPYKISADMTREMCLYYYRHYIIDKLRTGSIAISELEQLNGKTLGCWCKEKGQNISCHGDILVELLEMHKNGRLIQ